MAIIRTQYVVNIRQCGCQDTDNVVTDDAYGDTWNEPGIIYCDAHAHLNY